MGSSPGQEAELVFAAKQEQHVLPSARAKRERPEALPACVRSDFQNCPAGVAKLCCKNTRVLNGVLSLMSPLHRIIPYVRFHGTGHGELLSVANE